MKTTLLLFTLLVFNNAAYSKGCDGELQNILELEGIKLTEFGGGLLQIDVKAPEILDGYKIATAQLVQESPFILVLFDFPWKEGNNLVTQIFFATELLTNPRVEIFYGESGCSVLLRKEIHITSKGSG